MMGYEEALRLTVETVIPLNRSREADLSDGLGRVVFRDLYSQVDSPSADASMKDGYAVRSEDIAKASRENMIRLRIIGASAAGSPSDKAVTSGTAIRILTGAKLPGGADAVLAEEFAIRESDDRLMVFDIAERGRNVLTKGSDVYSGELIARQGSCLAPGLIGSLAAAGLSRLPVYEKPRVAILATGDELVMPGRPLGDGKLYASNLEMLKAWCVRFNMPANGFILKDQPGRIKAKIQSLMAGHDALITSGGAWTGDKDFVAKTLSDLGWTLIFHSIRIGPGKPVGFGLLNQKPVFVLPGGPSSNLTAFLKIALPGLFKLGGHRSFSLPKIAVTLLEEIKSRHTDWTQFVFGEIETCGGRTVFRPFKLLSRLKSMASANALVAIPEGVDTYPAGAMVEAELLI